MICHAQQGRSGSSSSPSPDRVAERTTAVTATRYARYVGRVGALAVVLGVGVAVTNGYGIAMADVSDGSNATSRAGNSTADKPATVDRDSGHRAGDGTQQTSPIAPATEPAAAEPTAPEAASRADGSAPKTAAGTPDSPSMQGNFQQNTGSGHDGSPAPEEVSDPAGDPRSLPDTAAEAGVVAAQSARHRAPAVVSADATSTVAAGHRTPVPGSEVRPSGVVARATAPRQPAPSAQASQPGDPRPADVASVDDRGVVAMPVAAGTTAGATLATDAATVVPAARAAEVTPLGVVASAVTGVVGALLAPLLGAGTDTPPAPPTFVALLAIVRREIERTLFNQAPTTAYDPTLNSQTAGGVVTGTLNAVDPDGDPLSYAVSQAPANGAVVVNSAGVFTYTPTAALAAAGGTDTFVVTVSNPYRLHLQDVAAAAARFDVFGALSALVSPPSSTVTVALRVNAAVRATDDTVTTAEDTVTRIDVLANDIDLEGDPLTAAVATGPAHGSLDPNADGTFSYTPAANFNGTDTFTYSVTDGTTSDTGMVAITVTAVNDAPNAVGNAFFGPEDRGGVADVLANDTDVEGDPLTITSFTQPLNGVVRFFEPGISSRLLYVPNADFNGRDAFSYTVSDGTDTATATVIVRIDPVNDAPVAVADTASTAQSVTVSGNVLTNDTDVDRDTLTATLASGPSNGTLNLAADGAFTYTPNPTFAGTDTFRYRASDGTVGSNTATVTITVIATNTPPVATPTAGTPESVLGMVTGSLNAVDADGDSLTHPVTAAPT